MVVEMVVWMDILLDCLTVETMGVGLVLVMESMKEKWLAHKMGSKMEVGTEQ